MPVGRSFIVAVLFMLVVIYLGLVVWGWNAGLVALLAVGGGLAVFAGVYTLINKYDHIRFFNSKWFIVALCILILVPLGWNAYLDMRYGYFAGDYSNYECSFCGEPADGGVFLSGRVEMNYYCKEDFAEVKQMTVEMDLAANEDTVWAEAKRIVEKKLKAPSTAEFCSMSEAYIEKDGKTWTIKGYVDAENSFGAKLRNEFTVVITFTDITHYTIDRCDITAQ